MIVVFPQSATPQSEFNKAGRTAFQFVKIGVGARQVALGEACIASIRDANSAFWNPAGLTGIPGSEASFSYARWLTELDHFSGAAAFRISGIGIVGLSYASLDYGSMQEALVTVPSGSADTRTGNVFTASDLLVSLSYAREFTDNLSIGVSVKFLQEKLFVYKANLFAYDIGTNYDIGYNGMRLAMSAQNFGPSVQWLQNSDREEGYDIPLVYRIGISSNLIANGNGFIDLGKEQAITVSAEAIHTNDYGDRMHVGAEYWFGNSFSLRGGYRFNYDEGNLSLGAGFNGAVSGINLRCDYAFVRYEYLNSPHRFTLSVAF